MCSNRHSSWIIAPLCHSDGYALSPQGDSGPCHTYITLLVTILIQFCYDMRSFIHVLFVSTCRRNPRASALSFNALQAMSALLCGGPVFATKVLDRESTLYRWLENMLSSGESRVTTCMSTMYMCVLQSRNRHVVHVHVCRLHVLSSTLFYMYNVGTSAW